MLLIDEVVSSDYTVSTDKNDLQYYTFLTTVV